MMQKELEDYRDLLNEIDYRPLRENLTSFYKPVDNEKDKDMSTKIDETRKNSGSGFNTKLNGQTAKGSLESHQQILDSVRNSEEDIEGQYYRELEEFEREYNLKVHPYSRENSCDISFHKKRLDTQELNNQSQRPENFILADILDSVNNNEAMGISISFFDATNKDTSKVVDSRNNTHMPPMKRNLTTAQLRRNESEVMDREEFLRNVQNLEPKQSFLNRSLFIDKDLKPNWLGNATFNDKPNWDIQDTIKLLFVSLTTNGDKKGLDKKPSCASIKAIQMSQDNQSSLIGNSNSNVTPDIARSNLSEMGKIEECSLLRNFDAESYQTEITPKSCVQSTDQSPEQDRLKSSESSTEEHLSYGAEDMGYFEIKLNKISKEYEKFKQKSTVKSNKSVKFDNRTIKYQIKKQVSKNITSPIHNLLFNVPQSFQNKIAGSLRKKSTQSDVCVKHKIYKPPKSPAKKRKFDIQSQARTIKKKCFTSSKATTQDFVILQRLSAPKDSAPMICGKFLFNSPDPATMTLDQQLIEEELRETNTKYEQTVAELKAFNYCLSEKLLTVMNENQNLHRVLESRDLVNLYCQFYTVSRGKVDQKILINSNLFTN